MSKDRPFSLSKIMMIMLRSLVTRTRPPVPFRLPGVADGELAITYLGHATTLLQTSTVNIITDPIFTSFALLSKRLVRPGVPFRKLPPIDLIIVSHPHFDHMSLPTLKRFPRETPTIVPRGCLGLVSKTGLKQIVGLSLGESCQIKGITISATAAQHWGRRTPYSPERGYCSYVVDTPAGSIFFAGDSGYFSGFRELGERRPIDIALLPISAYNPPPFRRNHMSPEDALVAYGDLGARYLIPIHWGTFALSYEPPDEPIAWFARIVSQMGLDGRAVILRHGETRTFRLRAP